MSVTFIDGPAAGVTLNLRRAPLYLRAVCDETVDHWDALDQLDDTPSPSETIHVYRRVGEASAAHVCIRGERRRESGWYVTARYEHVPGVDISGEGINFTHTWRCWVDRQVSAGGGEEREDRPTDAG